MFIVKNFGTKGDYRCFIKISKLQLRGKQVIVIVFVTLFTSKIYCKNTDVGR